MNRVLELDASAPLRCVADRVPSAFSRLPTYSICISYHH